MPGMGELLVILLIVLLVFGAGKLPGIGSSLGRAISNFRRGAREDEPEPPRLEPVDAGKRLAPGEPDEASADPAPESVPAERRPS